MRDDAVLRRALPLDRGLVQHLKQTVVNQQRTDATVRNIQHVVFHTVGVEHHITHIEKKSL